VRSIRYLELHKAIIAKTTEEVRQNALHSRKAMLESEFRRQYGLEAAGPEALAIIWKALLLNGETWTNVALLSERVWKQCSVARAKLFAFKQSRSGTPRLAMSF
jgi:hypothetical protein